MKNPKPIYLFCLLVLFLVIISLIMFINSILFRLVWIIPFFIIYHFLFEKINKIFGIQKKIVYTAGTWDLFHSGHLNLLKKSKGLGDYLIVGVSTNKLVKSHKGKSPILNYQKRAEIIKNIGFVDKVVVQNKLLDLKYIKSLKADIVTIGDDWKNNPALNKLKSDKKIKLVFIPYTKKVSTTKIKEKIKNGRD